MTTDPAVLAYARKVADEWGPWTAEEIEVLSRVVAPQLRAVRERRSQSAHPKAA